MAIAARLKRERVKKKVSLQDVADAVGASKAHVWELETGRSKNPSADLLTRLAEYYGIRVADLVGEAPLDDEDSELVAMYKDLKKLSPDDREAIKVLMQNFKSKRSK